MCMLTLAHGMSVRARAHVCVRACMSFQSPDDALISPCSPTPVWLRRNQNEPTSAWPAVTSAPLGRPCTSRRTVYHERAVLGGQDVLGGRPQQVELEVAGAPQVVPREGRGAIGPRGAVADQLTRHVPRRQVEHNPHVRTRVRACVRPRVSTRAGPGPGPGPVPRPCDAALRKRTTWTGRSRTA